MNIQTDNNATVAQLISAYDDLDKNERLLFSPEEDRLWMWAHKKPGRAEYHERFRGREDTLEWMQLGLSADRGGYVPAEIRAPLVAMSRRFDERLFAKLGTSIDTHAYDKYIGQWNADDYYYTNACATPDWQKVQTVLDFGAGYGRQINIWHQKLPNIRYIATEVVRKPSLCQCCYFQHLDIPYYEYALHSQTYEISTSTGVYHIPAWR